MTARRGSIRIVSARKQTPREVHRMPPPVTISAGDPERPWLGKRLAPDINMWGESDVRRIGLWIAEADEGSSDQRGSGFPSLITVMLITPIMLYALGLLAKWLLGI